MHLRLSLPVLLLAAAVMTTGCGPTKAGLDARAAARERINAFNANFTCDQARQEFEVGQFERALRDVELAIEQSPDVPEFHVLKGRIHLETHRLERAAEAFSTALEKDARCAEAHYYAGIVYQRWSDDTQSYAHYRSAYDIEADNVQYLLAAAEAMIALGRLDEARGLVDARLAYFEHNAALRHLLGQIALLEGDPKTAAQLYAEARLLDPDNDLLLEELAWAQYEAELYAQCHDTVTMICEKMDEPRADLIHLQARCLTMLDRPAEAHRLYLQLTRCSPAEASVWVEFGTIAWKLGDYRRVAQCGVRVVSLAPDRYEGYMLKGLYERHHGRLDEAARLLQVAADRADETSLPHLLLGRTLEEAGRDRAAMNAYADAMRVDPQSTEARSLYQQLEARLRVAAAEDGR